MNKKSTPKPLSSITDRPTKTRKALVCVVGLRGLPGVMGGVETHCEELLPRIAERQPDLEIEVVARSPYVPRDAASFRGVRVTPLFSPRGKHVEAIVSTVVGVFYAWRRGADIVHIHAVGPALVAPLARLLGMQVVFTHHGADYVRAKWGSFAKTVLRLGELLGTKSANAVIAVAPSLAQQLKRSYPAQAGKVRYVPNGAPALEQCSSGAAVLERFGIQRRQFVLSVGRLVPEKAHDLLIDAFRRSHNKYKLVIVGEADHESAYSLSLRQRMDSDVVFAGAQPRTVLRELYSTAALFVLASSHEGLPISALEAGALGCPMLLSNIQPHLDLRLPKQCYFPSGDVAALAKRLSLPAESFAVDPSVCDRFNWDQIAADTLATYRDVLAERGK